MLKSLLKKSCFFFSSFRKSPFQILNITKTANEDQIKKAYLTLAKKYHPDINPSYSQKFKQINEAYHILKDPSKRAQYNSSQQPRQQRTYNQYQNNPYRQQQQNDPFRDFYTRNSHSQNFYNQFHFHENMRAGGSYRRRQKYHNGFNYDYDHDPSSSRQQEYRRQMYSFRYTSLPQLLMHLVFVLSFIAVIGMMFSTMYTTNKIMDQRKRQYESTLARQYRAMVDEEDEFQL